MTLKCELMSYGNSLGLPLGLEAPDMTPNGVTFLSFLDAEMCAASPLLCPPWVLRFDMFQATST